VTTSIDLTPMKAKPKTIRKAMSNSFGFGGTNAAIVLGAVD
jgi:3-oxoacyl-[acyl-carrier-protein] synthase II